MSLWHRSLSRLFGAFDLVAVFGVQDSQCLIRVFRQLSLGAVLHTYPEPEAVHISEPEPAVSQVAIGVVAAFSQPSAALHFARYIAAKDRDQNHYHDHKFLVATGDSELIVKCG